MISIEYSKMQKALADMAKDLQEIANKADPSAREEALLQGAQIVVRDAQRRAPRRTGKLAAGITYGELTSESVTVGWSADAFYGRFQELGTSHNAARPHLVPAYEENKEQIFDSMIQSLGIKE